MFRKSIDFGIRIPTVLNRSKSGEEQSSYSENSQIWQPFGEVNTQIVSRRSLYLPAG